MSEISLNKDPESWARVRIDLIAVGSITQACNVLEMALQDISKLAEANNREVERRRAAEAEAQFWRQEMAAKLELLLAQAGVAKKTGEERGAADRRLNIRTILNAFRNADAKEWHQRCIECGEFILPGQLTVGVGDEDGTDPAHAACFSLTEGTPADLIDEAAVIACAKEFLNEASDVMTV